MNDENKTKAQLIKEQEDIRKWIAGLESAEEDSTGDPELANILDTPAIQSLMDSFHEFAHIPMAIVDLNGKVLAGPGWGDICKRFHRVHPETRRYCIESDVQLTAGVPAGEYKLYKCKNNMWDVATPIIVGGRHVGNVISGQFFFDDESIDYELFRSQARKYGFPEEAYIAALEAVPRFSRKSIDAGMAFFMKLAGMISQLSYGNIRLVRSLAERNALMNSLQTAEEKYRGIFENATEGIYRTSPAGSFLEVNPAFAEILGYDSPEELKNAVTNIGQQIYVAPEDREKWISVLDQQEYARFEVPWRRRDGSVCWVCLRARVVRDSEGKPICYEGFAEDVTERRKFVEELEQHREHLESLVKERTTQLAESENMYRTIFENTGNATLIFEEDTKISLTNEEFENLFRFTRKKQWERKAGQNSYLQRMWSGC
jgi:PAS domain S-box-containing protein